MHHRGLEGNTTASRAVIPTINGISFRVGESRLTQVSDVMSAKQHRQKKRVQQRGCAIRPCGQLHSFIHSFIHPFIATLKAKQYL